MAEACKILLSIPGRLETVEARMLPWLGLFIALTYRRVKIDVDNDD